MRPIKFRAWDTHEEVMSSVDYVDFISGVIGLSDEDIGDYEQHIYRVDIMQYTGLKDKNGVEIYEGDILYVEQQSKTIDQFIPHKRSVAVRYEAKDTAYVFAEEHGQAIGLYTIPDEIEVIGNIYENPELLGEETE